MGGAGTVRALPFHPDSDSARFAIRARSTGPTAPAGRAPIEAAARSRAQLLAAIARAHDG